VDLDKPVDDLLIDLREAEEGQAEGPGQETRAVVFSLDVAEGSPRPRGRFRIDYLAPGNPHGYKPVETDLEDGRATAELPVPTKVGYQPVRVLGYWIPSKHGIAVPAGAGPASSPAMPTADPRQGSSATCCGWIVKNPSTKSRCALSRASP